MTANDMIDPAAVLSHAKRELKLLGYKDEDTGVNKAMYEDILALLTLFAGQGHSHASANYLLNAFVLLASQKPATPLTGEPDEWREVAEGVHQNIRCNTVFRNAEGQAFNVAGIVYRASDGGLWQDESCQVPVQFPYDPTVKYVDRDVPKSPLEAGATHRPIVLPDGMQLQ